MENTHKTHNEAPAYFWYSPIASIAADLNTDHQWQPVRVDGDNVWFIGEAEPKSVHELPGEFVKAGKPIPMVKLTFPPGSDMGTMTYNGRPVTL